MVCSAALKLISFRGGENDGGDANELQFTVALSFSWSCCCCCSALLFVSSSNNPPNKSGDFSRCAFGIASSLVPIVVDACPPPSSSIQILSNNAAFTNPFILLVSLLSGFGNFNSSYLAKYFLFAFSFPPPLTNASTSSGVNVLALTLFTRNPNSLYTPAHRVHMKIEKFTHAYCGASDPGPEHVKHVLFSCIFLARLIASSHFSFWTFLLVNDEIFVLSHWWCVVVDEPTRVSPAIVVRIHQQRFFINFFFFFSDDSK